MTDRSLPYATAAAFRIALKDRFADIAKADSRYTVSELQRQFAYDRTLARLFTSADADQWVLKGAGALLARLERARHSKDIDVYFAEQRAEVQPAVAALRQALNLNLNDFFIFDVAKVTPLQEEAKGSRVHVQAHLGPKAFAAFHIDVVVGTTMSGEPDLVKPLTPVDIVGLIRPDKLCAIISTHKRGGQATSSRVKDLVDIALIAATQQVSGRPFEPRSSPTPHTEISLSLTHSPSPMRAPGELVTRESPPTRPALCRASMTPSTSPRRFSTPHSPDRFPARGIPNPPAGDNSPRISQRLLDECVCPPRDELPRSDGAPPASQYPNLNLLVNSLPVAVQPAHAKIRRADTEALTACNGGSCRLLLTGSNDPLTRRRNALFCR